MQNTIFLTTSHPRLQNTISRIGLRFPGFQIIKEETAKILECIDPKWIYIFGNIKYATL